MRADPALVYGQVEEAREGRRVVKVEKKLVAWSPATEPTYITTSLLERQNGTARSRNRHLVRKTCAFAKTVPHLNDQCGWTRPSITSAAGTADSKVGRLRCGKDRRPRLVSGRGVGLSDVV